MTTALSDYRENKRRDRMTDAQIRREDAAARVQAGIELQRVSAELRREERQARQAQRAAARQARADWRADRLGWVREHTVDLLFVPVIIVPGVLAWSAMAVYGHHIFGPAGWLLPAFSEGAMWAFEARATLLQRRDPGRSVWHLRLGSLAFCGVGAALNFLHGLPLGITVGLVMAIVSAAGLVAHQIVNLGPRRSRLERAIARQEARVRRAAVGRAVADLDARGNVTLIYRPGRVEVSRKHGRTVLADVAAPDRCVWLPWPMVLPGGSNAVTARLLDGQAAEAMTAYRDWRSGSWVTAFPAGTDATDLSIEDLRRQLDRQLALARSATAELATTATVPGTDAGHGAGAGPVPAIDASADVPDGQDAGAGPDTPAGTATATAAEVPGEQATRPRTATAKRSRRTRKLTTAEARRRMAKALAERPDIETSDLAELLGRSERTVRRMRGGVTPELAMAGREGVDRS